MIAVGVFMWFEESQVKQFFSTLADNFPDGEIVLDASSKLSTDFGAWGNVFPQEQRDPMQAALADVMKDWPIKDW